MSSCHVPKQSTMKTGEEPGWIKCQLGILSRPDGSALLSEGETTVIAGMYGPLEGKANQTLNEKASIESHFRPKSGLPGIKDKVNQRILRCVSEGVVAAALYPRTSVIVVIQEMQNNGLLLSCALNALCLALLDAGIDMKCMFAAVTCFVDQKDRSLTLTPPTNEEDADTFFLYVFDSTDRNLISCHAQGNFTTEQYKEALDMCREESLKVFEFFKQSVEKIK